MIQRVVIDTSTLVGAALRPHSIPDKALTLALNSASLYTSSEAMEELESVLRRSRFNKFVSLESRLFLIDVIRSHAKFVVVPQSYSSEVRGFCRDANDDFVLALALTANADVIVSSDHDLLALHPWRGIPILTAADFLAQFPL